MNNIQLSKHLANETWYKHFRPLAAHCLIWLARLLDLCGVHALAFKLSTASLRFQLSGIGVELLKKQLSVHPELVTDFVTADVQTPEAAQRSIILLWPQLQGDNIKKGVILVTFTRTFAYFLTKINIPLFERYFTLVLEPSWSGYADPDILAFSQFNNKLIVQCSEIQDRTLINSLPNTFVATSLGAGDWVNHREFLPLDCEKKYDSVYVANANPIKRVLRYIKAIRNIVDRGYTDYRACLICASWGGDRKIIESLVAQQALGSNLELKFSLSREEVIQHLNLSKSNVLLSYKEGSNRSLFEAMFCNTPVICIYENTGVNKANINEFTGLLVLDAQLENALIWMAEHHLEFSPRQWALNNISPEVSTQRLANLIKHRLQLHHVAPESLYVKTNDPEVQYFHNPKLQFSDINANLFTLFAKGASPSEEALREGILALEAEFNNRMQAG